MFTVIATSIIIIVSLSLLGFLAVQMLRSKQAPRREPELHFFVPNDFFISLILLTNFWMLLLVLIGSQELLEVDRHIIASIASLIAPFLSWWRKKKAVS